jgi:hypothetical protein
MPFENPWFDNLIPPHAYNSACYCETCQHWRWCQRRRASYDRARRLSQHRLAEESVEKIARKAVADYAEEKEREQKRKDEERGREERRKEEERKERDAKWVRRARERDEKVDDEVGRRLREWEENEIERRRGRRGSGWRKKLVFEKSCDESGRRRTYVKDVRVRKSEVLDWFAGW